MFLHFSVSGATWFSTSANTVVQEIGNRLEQLSPGDNAIDELEARVPKPGDHKDGYGRERRRDNGLGRGGTRCLAGVAPGDNGATT